MSTTRDLPTTTRTSQRTRWAVPVAVAGVVALAVATPTLVANAGDADLPETTAEQLVADVLAAEPAPLHGTVVHTARLGLPELPVSEMSGADPLALLGGSSTLRIWTDGTERSRVALLGTTSEYSVVRDGPEAWTYSSSDDEVVHYSLDAAGAARYEAMAEHARAGKAPEVLGELPTPQEGARRVLAEADATSIVSLDAPTQVAGRDAYQLVVTPRDAGTLVARVVLAVDAKTSAPLRYQVWSVQDATAPALEVGFTDVTFAAPDPAVLEFTAPAGSDVREVVVPMPAHEAGSPAAAEGAPSGFEVTGSGWSRVVTVSGVDVEALVAGDPGALAEAGPDHAFGTESSGALIEEFKGEGGPGLDLDTGALYEQLAQEVPGGRLISSALLSVLVTDDGRLIVGAVPPETLRGLA